MTPQHKKIIEEVHADILSNWSDEDINAFFLQPFSDGSLSSYHHTLGRYIRNKYNLWNIPWEPEMKEYLGCICDCSPFHPDAVSMTIIKEVWKLGSAI